jgi:hypothetical protein
MTYTDCFEYASLEAFKPARIIAEFPIMAAERGLGMLVFFKAGRVRGVRILRWSHSLLSHGREPFTTAEAAMSDFFRTKDALPRALHAQIFGAPADA